MTAPNDATPASLDRRRMFQFAGAAGAAGLLAACGGTSDSGDGATAPDDSSNDQGQSDVLATTGDVSVGGGVIVGSVVVTQPSEGDFRAFSSTCTHQGCTVSDVSDGTITCQCHGSQFSAEDGSVENGPASEPLPEVEITVDGDQIVRG